MNIVYKWSFMAWHFQRRIDTNLRVEIRLLFNHQIIDRHYGEKNKFKLIVLIFTDIYTFPAINYIIIFNIILFITW